MPRNARIAIIEDSPRIVETLSEQLLRGGHEVLHVAMTVSQALDIPQYMSKGIQVALVDGDLTESSHNGRDGREIVMQLKAQLPDILIVNISSGSNLGKVNAVAHKWTDTYDQIEAVIDRL